MTQLDVMFGYSVPPSEPVAMALGRIREVYGIRKLTVDEAEKTVRVEYDATRLTESVVHQLLRRTGLTITGQLSLIPPQPEPVAAPAAS
ncbi:hypothetical protein SAMN05421819_0790 [Bryocella elongata]|uniref:HMA domain-containing protein n=1 Tax=Bryocella elongata TaxID=863522 RepID=A0A1H5U0Q9_9BACT|nr:heavy-metal-associated domain-containing protein [Bryocella elongata]SEF67857.1 hypothetical protein SAMN05421819_0790 [Bryocella elongata]